jgi:hypothetical protein
LNKQVRNNMNPWMDKWRKFKMKTATWRQGQNRMKL